MNIVVLMKQVPDTEEERRLNPADFTVDRDTDESVINEADEFAIEEGLLLREANGGRVTVVTMGPERATEALRRALSMGVDDAVHVCDDALHGACAMQTATTLAAVLSTIEWELIIAGAEATDTRMSVIPAILAEALGVPQLTRARRVDLADRTVTIERITERGHDVVRAVLPAVVSVVEGINEPRYPTFKGVIAAKSKPIRVVDLMDLGIDPTTVGLAHATTRVVSVELAPPRRGGQVIPDDGTGGEKIADFLASHNLV